jgi:signal transduction histidine kinase
MTTRNGATPSLLFMSTQPAVEALMAPRRWFGGRLTGAQIAWSAAGVALFGLGVGEILDDRWHASWPVSAVFVVLATVPLAALPTHPVETVVVVSLAAGVDALLFSTPQSLAILFGLLFAAGGAARYAPRRALIPLLTLVTLVIVVAAVRDPTDGNPYDYFFTFGICATATICGFLVRNRHQAVVRAIDLAVQQRTEHRLGVERAITEERSRIARDLHDVVAHAVSLMVIQSAAGRAVAQRDPERAAAVFDTIESSGQRALADLRRLLGVLETGEQDDVRPPGLAAVEELVAQTNVAGVSCCVTWAGGRDEVPDGVDVAAYRVIQESITNALKHGARTALDITVTRSEAGIRVDVLDRDGVPSEPELDRAGHGLRGMRERVGMYDGTLAAGPTPEGWRVEAFFPVAST